MEIDMKDTALGRHEAVMKRELMASVPKMSPEELQALKAEVEACEGREGKAGEAGDAEPEPAHEPGAHEPGDATQQPAGGVGDQETHAHILGGREEQGGEC